MNVRKPTYYSAMFTALDELMAENLSQMELYLSIGRVVSVRPEKGAAVAAAEYLQGTYPDIVGFSPRSLRRMRDFYRAYESVPEVMAEAMTIGWTQNVVIMEADLSLQEKTWYIRAVRQFGWSKLKLVEQIEAFAHLDISLDLPGEVCYTEETSDSDPVYPPNETQIGGGVAPTAPEKRCGSSSTPIMASTTSWSGRTGPTYRLFAVSAAAMPAARSVCCRIIPTIPAMSLAHGIR